MPDLILFILSLFWDSSACQDGWSEIIPVESL